MGRAYSGHDFILLFLGLHDILAAWRKISRTLVGQMGDERISLAQPRCFYTVTPRRTYQSLAFYSNEIPSRNWWCQ